MKKVANYAAQSLNENYKLSVSRWDEQNPEDEPYTIEEWCDNEAVSDPNFYRWLFNDGDIEDFGSNLTDQEKEIASDFFKNL
jgi:hypothetical protein